MRKSAATNAFALAFLVAMFLAVSEVQFAKANPIISVYRNVSPPEGTQAPIVAIHTPINGSSYPKKITLTFEVIVPQTNGDKSVDSTKVYYKASWDAKEITVSEGRFGSFSIDLSDAPGGNLSVTIYAVGVGIIKTEEEFREENGVIWSYNYYDRFGLTSYSTVSFSKDLVPPRITLRSPQNATYASPDVKLEFTVNEGVSQILYSLDNERNQTIAGNTTLTGLTNGEHCVTLHVADLAGNAASSKTLFFNVTAPEPIPIVPIALAAVISFILVCVGLLVYFKKRKR